MVIHGNTGFIGSSLVSSTGEQTPSMVRQYGLTRKYASDSNDELAACLPPDLRHLLSATTATTPLSHHRQTTTTQRLQQHGLLRSSTAMGAANPLVSSHIDVLRVFFSVSLTPALRFSEHRERNGLVRHQKAVGHIVVVVLS